METARQPTAKPPEEVWVGGTSTPVAIRVEANCSRCAAGVSSRGGGWGRFVLTDLLPTAALTVFVVTLIGSGLPTREASLGRFLGATTSLSLRELTGLAVAVLAVAWITSCITRPFEFSAIRLLEGYWYGHIGAALGSIGVRLQGRRLSRFASIAYSPDEFNEHRQALAREQFSTYPSAERLLPTRLGNVLRAAEDEAGQRYGLDTVTMMPRLYPFLSERLADGLGELRDQLDVAARLCVTLLLATMISALLLLPRLLQHGWWLALPVATAVLAWVAYKAAIQVAIAYGRLIYVAFDLHRFDMLRGLHLPLPDAANEQEFNTSISEFFQKRTWVKYVDFAEYGYDHSGDTAMTSVNPTRNGSSHGDGNNALLNRGV
jgi:hypothetical protein